MFRVDQTKPSIPSISAPTDWQNTNVTVSITGGTDNDSGVNRINSGSWATYSSAITISTNGETTVEARTIDNTGNISDETSVVVKVDKVSPNLTLVPSTTEVTHEDVTITAVAIDHQSGVKRIKLPNDTWVTGSNVMYDAKYNGTYVFVVEDYAGNQTTEQITINNIDKSSSFEKPSLSALGSVTLGETKQTITANITPVVIKDWRDTGNEWRINVSATRAKLEGQSFYLPIRTMELKPVSSIDRVAGSGSMPTKELTTKTAIDNGQVKVAESTNSRGEYNIVFPSGALEVTVDATTAKAGSYESTITWEYVNAP